MNLKNYFLLLAFKSLFSKTLSTDNKLCPLLRILPSIDTTEYIPFSI